MLFTYSLNSCNFDKLNNAIKRQVYTSDVDTGYQLLAFVFFLNCYLYYK